MARIVMEGVITPGSIGRLEFDNVDVSQVLEALAQLGFRRAVGGPTAVAPVTRVEVSVPEASPAPALAAEVSPTLAQATIPAPAAPETPKLELVPPPAAKSEGKTGELPLKDKEPAKEPAKGKRKKPEPEPEPEDDEEDEDEDDDEEEEAPRRRRRKAADDTDQSAPPPKKQEAAGYDREKAMEQKRLRDLVEYLVNDAKIGDVAQVVSICVELREAGLKCLKSIELDDLKTRAKALAEAAAE